MEFCNSCKLEISKYYYSKHLKTKKHKRNAYKSTKVDGSKLEPVCSNEYISSVLEKYLCKDVINEIFSFIGKNEKRNKSCYHNCNGNWYMDKCCECLDKRPKDTVYQGYKDGVGMIEVERHTYYCQDCKNRINNI